MAKLPLIVTAKDDKNPTNTRVVPSDAAVHDTDTGITEFSKVAVVDVESAASAPSIAVVDTNGNIKTLQGTAVNDTPVWDGTNWASAQITPDIQGEDPITVSIAGSTTTIGLDPSKLANIPISAVANLQDELDSKVPDARSVSAGSGLEGGGTLDVDITISMPDVGTPNTYGSASSVPVTTTDSKGRVSSVVNTPIEITQSQVIDLTTDLTLKASITYVDTQDTATLASAQTYAESLAYNISSKDSVHAATTATLPSYTFLSNVLTADVDGPLDPSYTDNHSLELNQRVLVKNETNQQYNGIYYLSQVGNGSTPWKLTRTNDANSATELCGANVPVEVGDTLAGTLWIFSANSSTFTINVNPVVWNQVNVTVPDATTAVKGKIRLAGDLTGTADSPELIAVGTAGVYGSVSSVPVVTTDSKGRASSVVNTPIQIAQSQVTDLTTELAAKVPTTRTVSTTNGLTGGGALSGDLTLQPSYGSSANTVCEGNDSRLNRVIPNDVAGQYPGKPTATTEIMDFAATRAYTLDATKMKFRCKAQATGSSATMNITRTRSGSTVTLATVTFSAGGGTTGTVSSFSATDMLENDILSVVMTAIDSGGTFSDPFMTIAGYV